MNAGKYFSDMVVPFAAIYLSTSKQAQSCLRVSAPRVRRPGAAEPRGRKLDCAIARFIGAYSGKHILSSRTSTSQGDVLGKPQLVYRGGRARRCVWPRNPTDCLRSLGGLPVFLLICKKEE